MVRRDMMSWLCFLQYLLSSQIKKKNWWNWRTHAARSHSVFMIISFSERWQHQSNFTFNWQVPFSIIYNSCPSRYGWQLFEKAKRKSFKYFSNSFGEKVNSHLVWLWELSKPFNTEITNIYSIVKIWLLIYSVH